MNPASDEADWIFILVAWIGRTDHGEEIEGEEEIDEIQKESGAGTQKEESSKICGAETGETRRETSGKKGRSEAFGSGQKSGSGPETGSRSADTRARTGPVMDAAGQPGVRGQRHHLKTHPAPAAFDHLRRARKRAPCH